MMPRYWRELLVAALLWTAASACLAEMRLDVDEELRRAEELRAAEQQRRSQSRVVLDSAADLGLIQRGLQPERRIPNARFRVAVFTYEDPDGTGAGGALASLVGRRVVLESKVQSIGVLRYEGSLAPTPQQPLSYFEKVEKLVEAQQVTLAIWGMVRLQEDSVLVDTFVQLPPNVVQDEFSWKLALPQAMGGGNLLAQLRPSRILVQRQVLPRESLQMIQTAAKTIDTLRAQPNEAAPVIATLPVGTVYWFSQRQGDWVEISTDTYKGWVPSDGHCAQACTSLFSAAQFGSGLLQFIQSRRIPAVGDDLQPEAHAVAAQLSVLEQLDTAQPGRFQNAVLRPLESLTRAPAGTAAGAAFANIRAMAKLTTSLQAAVRDYGDSLAQGYDRVELPYSRVQQIAFELADASLDDPRNTDVLNNLAVLFRYARDNERASLAERLAREAVQQ